MVMLMLVSLDAQAWIIGPAVIAALPGG